MFDDVTRIAQTGHLMLSTVNLLQTLVEQVGKLLQILRALGKLDEPLVTALGIGIHKDRRSGIFRHLSPRLLTSIGQALLCIIHNQFLTKGIDEMLCTTGNNKLIGIGGGELHGIADLA